MKPNTLLWQLTRLRRRRSPQAIDDATLVAWRDGALSGPAERELMRQLADDPQARARLAALGGVAPAAAPSAVRERLLGQPSAISRSTLPWRRAMLAVAAAVVGVAVLLPLLSPRDAPPWVGTSEFEVQLAALAATRGAQPRLMQAYADTRLTITVEALRSARDGLEYAVFHDDQAAGGTLSRVEHDMQWSTYRGAAELSARADALVGDRPGKHTLWVVVAEAGAMPRVAPNALAQDALNGSRSRAYRLQLQLLAEDGAPSH